MTNVTCLSSTDMICERASDQPKTIKQNETWLVKGDQQQIDDEEFVNEQLSYWLTNAEWSIIGQVWKTTHDKRYPF